MCSFILDSGPSETGVSVLCLQSAASMSWAPGDLKSFYQYSFSTSAVCSSRRLIGFCGIAAELWCWEPKQVENLNFLPVRVLRVLLFCEWSSGLQMCFCVRDRQRCSGPFSYITVEMAFFKAFPAFLSDGWMYPGSREQCCMCSFFLLPGESSYTLSPYLCFVLSHVSVLVPALSLSVLCFLLHPVEYFYPLSTNPTGYSTTSLRQLVLLVESFRNVTTCSVFVMRSLKALGTLLLVIWYMFLLLLRWRNLDSFSHWWHILFHGSFMLF